MKFAPLNFCRQYRAHAQGQQFAMPDQARISLALDCMYRAVKFQLPREGRLTDDNSELSSALEGLPLRLPYPDVALEFWLELPTEPPLPLRGIVLLTEAPCMYFGKPQATNDPRMPSLTEFTYPLMVQILTGMREDGGRCLWATLEPIFMAPRNGDLFTNERPEGLPRLVLHRPGMRREDWATVEVMLFKKVVQPILDFLGVLACTNVSTQRYDPPKADRKIKAALPFDSYHYLVLKPHGQSTASEPLVHDHARPREHVRRGHIRRLASSRVFVRPTVVNPGIGGRVVKDYVVAA